MVMHSFKGEISRSDLSRPLAIIRTTCIAHVRLLLCRARVVVARASATNCSAVNTEREKRDMI